MARCLGSAARELRERGGIRMIDIATTAGVAEATIQRFETGDRWREETDRIVAAYAHELGIAQQDIWRAALERFA